MTGRDRIERLFTRWGHFVVRRRWATLALTLVVTAGLIGFLPDLRFDNSIEAFLMADDPERVRYDEFRARFGRDSDVLVILHPPEIFDLGFLETVKQFQEDVERDVPYVEEIMSLVNARSTYGRDEELVVEDLMEAWPQTAADLVALEARVLANPLYQNILIAESGAYTVVSIKPFTYSPTAPTDDALAGFDDAEADTGTASSEVLTDREGKELVTALRQVLARYEGPDFEAHMIGGPVENSHLDTAMTRDVMVFQTLSILIAAALLFLLFRRISGVVLPLVVVNLAMLATFGVMARIDIPMSTTLQILPAFLTVVGICDAIHILAIVYQRMSEGASRDEAIPYALGHSGLAVVMTSVTTAAGLMSFGIAEMLPIAQLGIIAPIGVMLAMGYSLVLLPALLAVLRLKPFVASDTRRDAADRFLEWATTMSTTYPWRIVSVTTAILVVFAGGVSRVHFSQDMMRWFPDGDPLRTAAELIDHEFGGATTLEVLIDTGRENGLHEPDTLRRIERAMRHVEALTIGGQPIGKSISIVDVAKETHQALNENRPAYYRIPEERRLIAQEMLLFENSGSDDLEDVTDSQFRTARMTVRTPWVDAMLYPDFVDEVRRDFGEILGPDLPFELTGGAPLYSQVFESVILSMARSYVFALAVVTPLLVLLVGNLLRGLVAMIPNLIPVFMVLGLMGWLDIPLDMTTLLIGGIVIGLAVDDTIHFMHKFNRYYEDTGSATEAVRATLASTGRAILFTSLVLGLGFAVFFFSYMNNTAWFGVLVSFSCLIAFLADVLVGPALMVLVTPEVEPSVPPVRADTTAWSAVP